MADGKLRVITLSDLQHGRILREVSRYNLTPIEPGHQFGISPQFADCVISKVEELKGAINTETGKPDCEVTLSRPHMRVDNGAAWCRVHEFKVHGSRLVGNDSIFRLVCSDRGEPCSVAY
jgi:hypothetical protein